MTNLVPLLEDSLVVWRAAGRVEPSGEGAVIRAAGGGPIVWVVPLNDPILPLRWQVRIERPGGTATTKSYAALPGMLRAVRLALDPEASQARLAMALGAGLT